jgi:hypothetical protein
MQRSLSFTNFTTRGLEQCYGERGHSQPRLHTGQTYVWYLNFAKRVLTSKDEAHSSSVSVRSSELFCSCMWDVAKEVNLIGRHEWR